MLYTHGLIAYLTKPDEIELFKKKLKALPKVKKASISEDLVLIFNYLQEVSKAGFRDVYVANQGLLFNDKAMGNLKETPVTFGHEAGNFKMSPTERKRLGGTNNNEFQNKSVIPQGYYRKSLFQKVANMNLASTFMGCIKTKLIRDQQCLYTPI